MWSAALRTGGQRLGDHLDVGVVIEQDLAIAAAGAVAGPSALPVTGERRDVESMGIANTVVAGLLRSPLHGILSGSTDLIRYTGRRSGRLHVTPTQYAESGSDVIILVGRPNAKMWWRNFRTEGDIEVLLRRHWVPMTATAVVGADDPEMVAPLLGIYLERFPRAQRVLDGESGSSQAQHAVIVWCRPR